MPLVKLYANLRSITGKKDLDIPGKDMEEVLGKLTRDHPELEHFLFEKGKLRPRVILTVNGKTLDTATGLSMPVSEQDQISIFPPVAGG